MKFQPASLFVGRWQPFHKGHITLIKTVLKQGKPVVIAIRDTELSEKNPYTVWERWTKIQEELKEYGSLVKIIVIPDIDEICYGREVGYAIRKIDLDVQTESISGTKTREANPPTNPIYWLTGQTGAGKTTLAKALKDKLGAIILDGDEMRESISLGAGFSAGDRAQHNLRVARLALQLAKQAPVLVSVIAPFQITRDEITKLIKPIWIYIEKPTVAITSEKPYEPPADPNIKVNSDIMSIEEEVKIVLDAIANPKKI